MTFSQREPFPVAFPPVIRTSPARRLSRVRFAWFVLGSIFGAAMAYCAVTLTHADMEYGDKENKTSRAFALLGASLAPLPQNPPVAVPSSPVPRAPVAQAYPPVAAPVVKIAGPILPASLNLSVQRGDTLMSMLMDKGVDHDEAYHVIESMKKVYNPKRLNVGQSLELHLDKSREDSSKPSVAGLSIAVSPIRTIALARAGTDSFTTREINAPVFKGVARAGGVIHSSLYQTGMNSGLPPQMLGEIINAYSYDIDFQRDIKEGDELDVVYERMHTDKGVTTGYGNVLYASLVLGDEKLTIYRHTSPDGFTGFYNVKGESVKKALLKTPINGAHITSGFGMRMHPLLGYTKMHKGIDFGAVTGTPIYAAGDGVIEEAGLKGGYGNYVRVKHNATYATAYGHASRIASGIRPGVHVKQGQVIAYVGSTGRSTGPHLHYEILINGAQVNPSGVKFRTGQMLAGHELVDFKHQVKQVQTALATLSRNNQVASLER